MCIRDRGKVLLSVLGDYRVLVYINCLHGRTINAEYYCELMDKVKAAYWSKNHNVPIFMIILHSVLPPQLMRNCSKPTGPGPPLNTVPDLRFLRP